MPFQRSASHDLPETDFELFESVERHLIGEISLSRAARCFRDRRTGSKRRINLIDKRENRGIMAPMPSAKDITATAVNTGLRRNERKANRISANKWDAMPVILAARRKVTK